MRDTINICHHSDQIIFLHEIITQTTTHQITTTTTDAEDRVEAKLNVIFVTEWVTSWQNVERDK